VVRRASRRAPHAGRARAAQARAIHGLNYKDKPDEAAAWLHRLGDPYTRTGADLDGRAGIDWGVYGVPETFVIDAQGRIAYKHIGPMTEESVRDTLLPMIEALRRQGRPAREAAPPG
jgi:cytochrome c biogenesis protein CcmG/thiol:disulfide interchange protein DsbE